MFFPHWRPAVAPGLFCPSEEDWGRDGGKVRGESQRTATGKFPSWLSSSCSLSLFLISELNLRGFTLKACAGRIGFPIFWAVQPSVPISSWFPVIFILPFIKINMPAQPHILLSLSPHYFISLTAWVTVNKNNLPLSHNFKTSLRLKIKQTFSSLKKKSLLNPRGSLQRKTYGCSQPSWQVNSHL